MSDGAQSLAGKRLALELWDPAEPTASRAGRGGVLPRAAPLDSSYTLKMAANSEVWSPSPCTLFAVFVENGTASNVWLAIVDKATAPAAGVGDLGLIRHLMFIPLAQGRERVFPRPIYLAAGAAFCFCSAMPAASIVLAAGPNFAAEGWFK